MHQVHLLQIGNPNNTFRRFPCKSLKHVFLSALLYQGICFYQLLLNYIE